METLLEDLYGPMLRFLPRKDVGRMAQMSRTWEYHCHHVEDYRSHLDLMISIYELNRRFPWPIHTRFTLRRLHHDVGNDDHDNPQMLREKALEIFNK